MVKRLIERPIAVTMSIIAIVVLGFISMRYLPVSLMPNIDIPQISVHVSAPGMSVREVNDQLLSPLRSQLMQVIGLKSISTEARSDMGILYLDFEPNCDMDIAFIEVNEKVDRASQNLPDEIERPKIIKSTVTDIPAFYLNVSLKNERAGAAADNNFTNLSDYVKGVVAKRVEQLPQSAMADISGVVSSELLCIPDEKKLTSMGVDTDFLGEVIEANNITLGALSIRDGQFRYNIQFDAQITSKEDIEEIYINHNGRIFQFKELCQIVERPAQRSGLIRSGGNNALSIAIIKQSDARMEDLQSSVNELIENLEEENPNIRYELTRDQTQLLSYSINSLGNNLIFGAVLACLVIFCFMGDVRSPLLIIITIPLSLIVTMLTFHIIGISINIISLSGLILGVGMMVDNSIIVIDNIMQRWSGGEPLNEAIPAAVGEVFTPMLSSILTTCSVFLPLIFLSGVAGALFYDQAMAVTIALFSSLFVSILILPVYFYMLYRKRKVSSDIFSSRIDLYKPYEKIMGWTLRHSKIIMLSFILLIPATYFIYQDIEKSNLPEISYDDTIMRLDWNSGISLEESDRRVAELLETIDDECQQTTSMVGTQQFMMSHTPTITTSEAIVYIKAMSSDCLPKIKEQATQYIDERYATATIDFEVSGNIFDMIFSDGESDLTIELRRKSGGSPTVEEVNSITKELSDALHDVNIQRPLLEQNILYVADVERMALYNISYNKIYSKLRSLVSQNALFEINQGGASITVISGEDDVELSDILSSKVRNTNGVDIPLSLLVREYRSEDFKRLYSNSGGDIYPLHITAEDRDIENIIDQAERIIKEDDTFFASYSGSYFTSREMIGELILILIVAIALLYFILAAQFESIIQPIIILLEIMVDLFFVMVVLWLLGESLNLMSLIGIVVMSGIIINDSILKVDTINRLRRDGVSLLRALHIAGHKRLKPILMTSLTTILAIAPFLRRVDMGSDLQYPLSLAIIVGMIFGTLVSLFFIPLLYYVIYKDRRV